MFLLSQDNLTNWIVFLDIGAGEPPQEERICRHPGETSGISCPGIGRVQEEMRVPAKAKHCFEITIKEP